ncbi:MAG: hypothetical protein HYZ40_04590, partial [Rhodospirillales bacterium]|nr:hypothetical protein [Rhodospirillales bacterium]
MPTSSVAVRSLALAILGLGAASAAFAQGSNVTAFNPYSGVGLPGGPVPQYGPQAAYPIVDTVGPTAGGPAFNPWQPGRGVTATYPVTPGAVSVGAVSAGVPPPAYGYNPGAYLPAPPPGPIESRVVAIPELGTAPASRRSYPAYTPPSPPPVTTPAAAPPPVAVRPEPVPVPAPKPTPTPPPAAPVPMAAAPAPPAVAPPPPPQPVIPSRTNGAVAATVAFTGQSADLSDAAKTDLDRLAKNLGDRSLRQIEVRAYSSGADPDSRKVSLARA